MSKFDWNKNGKKDAFDHYMDMKVMSNESDNDDLDNLDIDDDIDDEEDIDVDTLDNNEKYLWRYNYDYDFDTDINPIDYETEDEYLEALEQARLLKDDNKNKDNKIQKVQNNNSLIYNYCKVVIDSLDKKYDYLYEGLNLNINDQVIVPFGKDNKQVIATIVAIGKCLSCALPCELNLMKKVLKIYDNKEIISNTLLINNNKKDCNIVYEDDYIKISIVKWVYNDYIIGGRARTGTFLFENKYDKRFCIYFKDITVDGFLNQSESHSVAFSGKQKGLHDIIFVYDNKIPECSKNYKSIEFKVCYGTIKEGYNLISRINFPLIESETISLKI